MAMRGLGLAAGLAALLCAGISAGKLWAAPVALPKVPAASSGNGWRDSTMGEYRQHLEVLGTLVEACAKARNKEACNPKQVGADDRVPWTVEGHAGKRMIRFTWLRNLLVSAQQPDKPDANFEARKKEAEKKHESVTPATTGELLVDAEARLKDDAKESEGGGVAQTSWTEERAALQQVLAGKEFRNLQGEKASDRFLEKLSRWLNSLFAGASKLRITAPWLGRAIVVGFVVLVCVGLVWGLLQFERRWRVRLVPEGVAAAGSPSARDWQKWLEDARRAAAEGRWREAIHFVYWAAISRLEQKRLWPADKARTPREYLALVGEGDTRKSGLTQLTRSFERTWYGGRAASRGEYENAEALAAELIGQTGGLGSGPRSGKVSRARTGTGGAR
ncbi:MAG: DUF4129 domain-containing protein [Terracidiphilus sp.]